MFCCRFVAMLRSPVDTVCVAAACWFIAPDADPTSRPARPPTLPSTDVDSVDVTDDPLVNSLATLFAICETVRARSLLLFSRSDSDSDCLGRCRGLVRPVDDRDVRALAGGEREAVQQMPLRHARPGATAWE